MNRYRLTILLILCSYFGYAQEMADIVRTSVRGSKNKEFSVRNLSKDEVYTGSRIRVKITFAPPTKKMRRNMTIVETIPEGCTAEVTHYAGGEYVVQGNKITFRYRKKTWRGLYIVYNLYVKQLPKGMYKIEGEATYGRSGYFAVIREMARIPIPASKKRTKITMKESCFTVKQGVRLIRVEETLDE